MWSYSLYKYPLNILEKKISMKMKIPEMQPITNKYWLNLFLSSLKLSKLRFYLQCTTIFFVNKIFWITLFFDLIYDNIVKYFCKDYFWQQFMLNFIKLYVNVTCSTTLYCILLNFMQRLFLALICIFKLLYGKYLMHNIKVSIEI